MCNSVFTEICPTAGVQMYVCNRDHYGYLPVPLKQDQTLEDEEESFTHTMTEALSKLVIRLQLTL